MRLPWPFGQRTPSDGSSKGEPAEGPDGPSLTASPTTLPTSRAAAGDAPPTGAWRSLPPIQRATGPAPLVAPPAAFLADVPGHQGLPSIIPQLGHETSPAAPSGLVVARVAATPSLTSSSSMPVKHVQRRTAVGAHPADAADTTSWSRDEPGAMAPTPSAPLAPVLQPTPVRSLAAVTPSATVTPAARPLTVAPAPAPVVQRSTASHAPASGTGSVPGPRSGRGAAAPATPAMPPAARAGGPVQRSRWSEAAAPGPTTTPSATPGPAGGRAGLGSPIGGGHETPSAAVRPEPHPVESGPMTTTAAPALPAASGGARRAGLGAPVAGPLPVAQRSVPTRATSATSSRSAEPGSGPSARPLPVLPVARRAAASSSEPPAHATSATARAVAGAPPTTPAGPSIVPILGARPLRSSIPVQRAVDSASGAAPDVVSAAWAPPATLPDTVASLPLQRHDDTVPLQRLADTPAKAGNAAAAPVPLREITLPALAAAQGDGSSDARPDAFAGPGVPGPAVLGGPAAGGHGSPSTSAGVAWAPGARPSAGQASVQRTMPARQRTAASAPLALARPHAAGPTGPSAGPAGSSHARTGTWITSEAPAPTVQTTSSSPVNASAGTSSQLPVFTATPVVQRVEGSAPQAPAKEGHTETELDELAKAIFSRIRNRLRTEVIHEREAKGLTFDAF